MWFTEEPWMPILGCVLAALALFGIWRTNGEPAYFKGMIAAVVAAFAIYGIERSIVTPAERIDDNVHDMVDAFRRNDLQRTLSHVSPNAEEERDLISAAIGMVDISDDLRVTDMEVTVDAGGRKAVAKFRVNASASVGGSSRLIRTRWLFDFDREGDEWRVSRIQRMKLLQDEVIDPRNTSEI